MSESQVPFHLSLERESFINNLRQPQNCQRFQGEKPKMRDSSLLNAHPLFPAARVVTSIKRERNHPDEDRPRPVGCLLRSRSFKSVHLPIWRS
jgi:hypothetical protein